MIYHLFISHSWTYSDAYEKLVNLLDSKSGFEYKNYSIPKDAPVHDAENDKELKEAIENQMKHASCILILAGVYATYSKWINAEIDIAQDLKKKIIAVEPWGSQKTSSVVKHAADEIVKWNTDSIIKAIQG